MTLIEFENLIKQSREEGANDNSTVYTMCEGDFCHVETVDYDPNDNSINILSE